MTGEIFNLKTSQPTLSKEPKNLVHGKCLVTKFQYWN